MGAIVEAFAREYEYFNRGLYNSWYYGRDRVGKLLRGRITTPDGCDARFGFCMWAADYLDDPSFIELLCDVLYGSFVQWFVVAVQNLLPWENPGFQPDGLTFEATVQDESARRKLAALQQAQCGGNPFVAWLVSEAPKKLKRIRELARGTTVEHLVRVTLAFSTPSEVRDWAQFPDGIVNVLDYVIEILEGGEEGACNQGVLSRDEQAVRGVRPADVRPV